VVAAESVGKLPPPWFVSGDHGTSYQAGIDNVETISGKGAKFLRYAQGEDKGFGSLVQVISAQRYLGQRALPRHGQDARRQQLGRPVDAGAGAEAAQRRVL
jgi:hypothetical protein